MIRFDGSVAPSGTTTPSIGARFRAWLGLRVYHTKQLSDTVPAMRYRDRIISQFGLCA